MKIKKILYTIPAILVFATALIAQVKKINPGEIQAPVKINKKAVIEKQNQITTSNAVIDFENRMTTAKFAGNRDEILRLRNESDRITGTVTKAPEQTDAKRINIEQTGNILANSISNINSRTLMGMATCTEQSGNNAGRIWAVYSYYPNSPPYILDGIGISYSDNGKDWTDYGSYSFGQNIYIGDDLQIDAELIINSSNQKYLWIVYKADVGLTNTIRTGLFILNLNSAAFSNSFLSWPGGANVFYKTPRIVSDNSQYPDNAFVYIVSSFDSSNTLQPYTSPGVFGEKVAVCYDPYTTSPLISYRPRPFTRTLTGYVHNPAIEHFNCDIAYYRNGGQDSIMIIETGLESVSSLVLLRTSVVSFLSSNPYEVYQGTINVNSNKRTRGFIASNGAYNHMMISVNYEFSAEDHDIEYYHSTNGSENWLRGYIDFSEADLLSDADIAGQRNNPGKFVIAANTKNPVRLNYYQSDSYNWAPIDSIDFSHLKSNYSNPKAGIRLNSTGENCFAIWADTTRIGLWSSAGCSGLVQSFAKLKLAGVIEGLYIPNEIVIPDTIRVYLRNSFAPYNAVDSSIGLLNNYFTSDFIFSNAPYNVLLYIQIKHRNALESWSSSPITISSYESFYNFLKKPNTFGNNSKRVDSLNYIGEMYGFYSGDVNQDGDINLTDVIDTYNSSTSFATGYISPDINGDNVVNLSDMLIVYNNSTAFVHKITP